MKLAKEYSTTDGFCISLVGQEVHLLTSYSSSNFDSDQQIRVRVKVRVRKRGRDVRNLLCTARHVRGLSFMPRACGTCLAFLFGSGTLFTRRGMKGVGCVHVMIYMYNVAHTLTSLVSFRASGLCHAPMHARRMLWLMAHDVRSTDARSGARRLPAVSLRAT